MKKDFDEYFDEIIGTLQLTKVEKKKYKDSLKSTLKRWEIKGLIEEGELPERGSKRIQEWMMDMDKSMVIQMVGSLEKRIFNYRRKIFGLVGTTPQKEYIAYMVNEMMKDDVNFEPPRIYTATIP